MLQFPLIEKPGDLDLVPLFTTCEYAGPASSYMPIATVRFAFCPDEGAVFVFNSFETEPFAGGAEDMEGDHLVCAAFDFFPEVSGSVLSFAVNAEGRCRFCRDGVLLKEVRLPLMRGEEERGIFWGARVCFGRDLLKEVYGRDALIPGQRVEGNVFKAKSSHPGKHFGAIAPLAPGKGMTDRENLRPFTAAQM